MRSGSETFAALASVFTQFWQPVRAYGLLSTPRGAGLAMIAVAVVILAGGYLPTLFIDWEEVDSQWREVRWEELHQEGMTAARADSVIASELGEIRGMTDSMPLARLIERAVIGCIAGLAAFGLVYAVSGSRQGRAADYVTSAMLSQGAYMITGVILVLAATLLRIPPSVRLNLAFFLPVDTVSPTRIHVFLFRFLDNIDFPSIVSLLIWGSGLSALVGKPGSWGMRLCFTVYLTGILLISLPVFFAPAA